MKAFIRSLPAPAEFVLVLLLGFGLGIAFQAWAITHQAMIVATDSLMTWDTVLKLVELGAILWIGRIRGWSVATFGWRISWKGTAGGILLFIVVTLAKILVGISLARLHPQPPGFVIAGLTLPVIILVSVINPFFEELLEAGYFFHFLKRHGMWLVVLAGGLFRGMLHLYQGINGATAIFAGGVIISLTYWRWRQLWPLVVAHVLDDFIGLLSLRHAASGSRF
ncbi:MAG: CPBP family intramembrane metalloprotease [Verrucomicrobiae bacterium]|nr:CPBP family intramembrane metalloprotease [Verrucomicrobiae bacterium]